MRNEAAKNQIINLRVSSKQKELIKKKAESLGLKVSEYLLASIEHQSINVVDGGKELAQELFRLNKNLEQFTKYPFVPVQELRDTVSQGIQKINAAMKEGF